VDKKESKVKKAAGWYPEDKDSSRARYWNGKVWTDLYADSESGEVTGNELFEGFLDNLGKSSLGAGVTKELASTTIKEMLLKVNKLEPPKFICFADKPNKAKFILLYNGQIALLESGYKLPDFQVISLASIESFEYSYLKMFLRYPSLKREEFSQINYDDFKMICEISGLKSFGESELGSYIGKVTPEGYLERSSRQNKTFTTASGSTIEVWSKRIRCVNQEYLLDEFVEAQVYLDGEVQITQRPTLTRMAFGSVLPGSALIPGLAFQKKQKNDLRETVFTVAGANWNLSVEISPNQVNNARSIATQINLAAKKISKSSTHSTIESNAQSSASAVDQLTKLEALRTAGTISEEEFLLLKSQILS
jgi:hypothetical protein